MKECSKCKVSKPQYEFGVSSRTRDKRNSWCKSCVRERGKKWYVDNLEKSKRKSSANTRERREWMNDVKSKHACVKCNENHISCLDFHHLNSTEKEFDISTKIESSKGKILEEINKCACLCANCHRKHHAGKLFGSLVKLNITQSYEV